MIREVRNPRTGEADYRFEEPSAEAIALRCGELRNRQPAWSEAGITHRVQALQDWKQSLIKHRAELVDALTTDTGRYAESELEVDVVLSSIDRWCRLATDFFAPPARKLSSIPFIELQQDVVPFALVGVISPWNFPLLLSLIDTLPALLAGCAVVVKPSEVTPRFIEVVNLCTAEVPALQPVLAYLAGTGATGATLVNQCDLICFTGSTSTGRKVYAAAAERMIPVFLELGGKDPAVVLPGADLRQAVRAVLWGSCVNAGHSCLSIERVYVHISLFDEFVHQLCEQARSVSLALDDPKSGQIGPIIFDRQVDIINRQLADARDKGAVLHTGSWQCEQHGGGYYLRPTVLTCVHNDMLLMREETFGPIIPVMAFDTAEEAIALANFGQYGLSAAVFAGSDEEAMAVASKLEAGAISINDAALTAIMHEGEKNSFKLSGIGGTRMGPSAIRRFMRQKVYIIKNTATDSPWWWPDANPTT